MHGRMNGPDWTDIAMMMSAIESLHECRVELVVITAGQGHNGGLTVKMSAIFDRLPKSEIPRRATVGLNWPSGRAQTFDGLVFMLLYELDYAIQRLYEQLGLPVG